MKAYVIKIKEGCYWLGGFCGINNYDDITHAKIYHLPSQAEKQCKLVNETYGYKAKVVPVTISEDDLEQENKTLREAIFQREDLISELDDYFEDIFNQLNPNWSEEWGGEGMKTYYQKCIEAIKKLQSTTPTKGTRITTRGKNDIYLLKPNHLDEYCYIDDEKRLRYNSQELIKHIGELEDIIYKTDKTS